MYPSELTFHVGNLMSQDLAFVAFIFVVVQAWFSLIATIWYQVWMINKTEKSSLAYLLSKLEEKLDKLSRQIKQLKLWGSFKTLLHIFLLYILVKKGNVVGVLDLGLTTVVGSMYCSMVGIGLWDIVMELFKHLDQWNLLLNDVTLLSL